MIALLLATVVAVGVQAAPADRFEFEFSELSPGVWAGVRENSPQFPVMGSTTFVITEEGVVVFDGGGSALMSEGLIDFQTFEERFTQGNPAWEQSWDEWFTEPMRKAAFKALTGEPMVDIH